MDSISIINEVVLNEEKGRTSVKISMKSYNYLCRIAGKYNVLSRIDGGFIEMDYAHFLDILTAAHYEEVNYHRVSEVLDSIAS